MSRVEMAVLLDLDGTLIDSKPGIAASIRVACDETGLAQPDEAVLHAFIGPPLGYSLEEHYGLTDTAFIDGFVAAYRRAYLADGMRNGVIYPGIEDALAEFRRGGERLFVATSKPRVHAETMLGEYGLAGYFDSIHGSELDGERFDKTELIAHILGSESLDNGAAIMVGDRRFDI
ncbi:MAG: HAD hydrolase-like protein, partial [Pseudomonadota bacterium]